MKAGILFSVFAHLSPMSKDFGSFSKQLQQLVFKIWENTMGYSISKVNIIENSP
ncbi:hypothetical protein RintRC_0205 [Richelia intracellularis]|nr:hypothetical protein RintRC_0205 [Richelia intracellularis]